MSNAVKNDGGSPASARVADKTHPATGQGQRGRKRLVKTVRHTLGGTEEMTLDDARSRAIAGYRDPCSKR